MFGKASLIALCVLASLAQAAPRIALGQSGATVEFTQSKGGWGVRITGPGSPALTQSKPAQIELFTAPKDIHQIAAGYKTVRRVGAGIEAQASLSDHGHALFRVDDVWSVDGDVISVKRRVYVIRTAPGGFGSSVQFAIDPQVKWDDVKFLAPGILYGDPSHDGERTPGGTLNYAAHRLMMREDILPAPLFAASFANGTSVAMLDPTPRGGTTEADTTLSAPTITNGRLQFGALGATQQNSNPIELAFRFPGTVTMYGYGPGAGAEPNWIRRYHPITKGLDHHYEVRFRFGQNESFPGLTREAWRWAWATLHPPILPLDVDLVRRVLTDHLEAQALNIDGRTGIPFAVSTVPTNTPQWNATMIAMGFVSKNLECANQLLLESDRDPSERGQKMRATGLNIIKSMIDALPTMPLQGTGYDLATGKPWYHVWLAPWLRNASEDMRVLMQAYQRERTQGRDHPEWLAWVKNYSDWLIAQQRADGSFPRRWLPGSDEVAEPSGTVSYAPVPLLVLMTDITKDPKYRAAAVRAGEYVWSNWGQRGLFVGGASDNANSTDKEAGMLSLEAYLSLYDATHEAKWLDRAKTAANFAESWIWIWNLPMPVDADNAKLHWKKGVPTVGLQGITAMAAGGADEYLDWAAPSYAKLYKLTGDAHYRDVAQLLLHDTKSMVALPGRLYDMKGPGWQQEHWSMGPGFRGRGRGSHRFWLPWVSANHLHSITGLEELDPALFKELSEPK